MGEGNLTITITQEELCFISLALDRWAGERCAAAEADIVKRLQRRFDKMYRTYHDLRAVAVSRVNLDGKGWENA